jgi:hypothetical protein
MNHRLTFQELFAVRRALAAGTRHVEIARALNLSVWTIAKIDDDPLIQEDPVREDDLPVDDAPADYVPENLRRCPGCGAMIYLSPCLACKIAVTARVPPAEEVVDELEDMIGWDVAAIARRRRREVASAGCGRRRRTKRGNLAYRVKMARVEARS